MALSRVISEIKRDIASPPLYRGHRRSIAMLGVEKLEWCGYWMVKSLMICLGVSIDIASPRYIGATVGVLPCLVWKN